MQGQSDPANLLRENWFWAGIFRDHATFIHDHLAPDQPQLVEWARAFKQEFTQLHDEAERMATAAGVTAPAGSYALTGLPAQPLTMVSPQVDQQATRLTSALLDQLNGLKAFKQQILQLLLACQVKISLTPSLINHMIMEAIEAMRVLRPGEDHLAPPLEAIHLHRVWLADAAGHAAVLNSWLDPTEQQLETVTRNFKQVFDGMHIKAVEMQTMLQVAPRMDGALRQLKLDARDQINAFRAFLVELREHLEGCTVLGALMPLLADHMVREELYYMEKLLEIGPR